MYESISDFKVKVLRVRAKIILGTLGCVFVPTIPVLFVRL